MRWPDPGAPVVLGTSSFGQDERGFPVFDAYWAAGGRSFDTAWLYGFAYGPGCCEETFGRWAQARGVGGSAWVLAKGAHTPECRPEVIADQLGQSLERMGRDSVALYMMHRDDEQVPVGEFVTALADLVERGVAGAYGMSNWSLPRVRAAAAEAHRRGLPGPVGVSNQFSLVEMIRPIFPGTVDSRSPQWRAWLGGDGDGSRNGTPDATEHGIDRVVLYPWASQGRGCHALADPDELRTGALAECWFSPANAERVARAAALAAARGTSATGVALAWTRSQPFPVRPVIGPRQVAEVTDSMAALTCELTPAERDWLDTGEGPAPV